MALDPNLQISNLTNAQCALLRDELVALVGANTTVRRIRRCAKAGDDLLADRALAAQEAQIAAANNAALAASAEQLASIRAQRNVLGGADYNSV